MKSSTSNMTNSVRRVSLVGKEASIVSKGRDVYVCCRFQSKHVYEEGPKEIFCRKTEMDEL